MELSQSQFSPSVWLQATWTTRHTHSSVGITHRRLSAEKVDFRHLRTILEITSQISDLGPWTPKTSSTTESLSNTVSRLRLTLLLSTQVVPSLPFLLKSTMDFKINGRTKWKTWTARLIPLSVRVSFLVRRSLRRYSQLASKLVTPSLNWAQWLISTKAREYANLRSPEIHLILTTMVISCLETSS